MGRVFFPIENIRKDVTNSWRMYHYTGDTAEEFTIPFTPNKYGYYTIFLKEQPDNGSIPRMTSRPVINGYKEVTKKPVNSDLSLALDVNEFYVNYTTGEIMFNPAAAGDVITVDYWGKGSVIEAEDINALYGYINNIESSLKISFDSFKLNGNSEDIHIPINTYFPSTGNLTIDFEMKESNILQEGSISVSDTTDPDNPIVLVSGLNPSDSPRSISMNRITYPSYKKKTYTISGKTLSGNTFSQSINIYWEYDIYVGGYMNKKEINTKEFKVPRDFKKYIFSEFPGSFINIYTYPAILLPASYGNPKTIKDLATEIGITVGDIYSVELEPEMDIKVPYNLFVSQNKIDRDVEIAVEL